MKIIYPDVNHVDTSLITHTPHLRIFRNIIQNQQNMPVGWRILKSGKNYGEEG